MIFPHPPRFFFKPVAIQGEMGYMFHPDSGGIKERLGGGLLSPVVMPPISRLHDQSADSMLSVQKFSGVPSGPAGLAAALGWMTLLGFGVVALVRGSAPLRFRLVLGSVFAGQIVLHQIYGEETFLYALHFLPVLLLTVSLATLTRRGRLVEFLLAPTILLVLWTNLNRLDEVAHVPFHEQNPRVKILSEPDLGIDAQPRRATLDEVRSLDRNR